MPSSSKTTVVVGAGTQSFSAYLSRPAAPGPRPAVIVIHEWWGLNAHIRDVADRYSAEGYVALAPDLYGGKVANDPGEAIKLVSGVTPEASKRILEAALDYLQGGDFVKPDRIGVTGFCFGGTQSFYFACASSKIAAAAIYYATRLPSDDMLARITAPLLVVYGDQDPNVKPAQARQLEATLRRLGKDVRLLVYPGCPHAFFNDENKAAYREEAARDAWGQTLKFFGRTLGPGVTRA